MTYSRWVLPSYKAILESHCDEFLESTDRGSDKARSKVITQVAKEITDDANQRNETLPDDLEKSLRTWYNNYSAGHAKEEKPANSKADTRGHPTSAKSWTAKSVCGQIYAERVGIEHKKLSEEKAIGKYTPALSSVFEDLSEAERKQCEEFAVEWNTKALPDEVQRRLSKTIPTEVTDFFKYINNRTGAVMIAFAAYTDEDGEQTYARYETNGLNFFATRKEHRKGPNNIVGVWKNFNLETIAEADSKEAIEFDDEEYPQLPENVMELRLQRRKGILRQYMSANRRFYGLGGRIPWNDIADSPSDHMSKGSRPDSDHRLEEPSHMKSVAVDAWLQHWLKLQKKNKRALVLKDRTNKASEPDPTTAVVSQRKGQKSKAKPAESRSDDEGAAVAVNGTTTVVSKRKGRKSKVQPTESGRSDEEETAVADNGRTQEGESQVAGLPPTPKSAAFSRKSRRTFLESLSNNKHYRKFIQLLLAAKDGDFLEGNETPTWASWDSTDNYLTDVFYDKKSTSSLSALLRWTAMDPITADGDTLAAYKQVELVILSYGLAFRALWVAQFPELYSDVPAHVLNSSYPFSEYEQLGHSIQDLIAGYADTLKEIESAYADRKRRPKPSAHHGSPKKSVGNKQTEEELTEGRGKKGPNPRRLPGLNGVPTPLQYLREEVGLAGTQWESLGADWQALGALWLRAETALCKSGRVDLTYQEINSSSIPDEWKDWMYAKLMRTDANRPADTFGQVFTDYLNGLPETTRANGGTIMSEVWCRPGRTGILGLLLCLYWQAEYSGAGNDWKVNLKVVEDIFNAILGQPDLQRAKRNRAGSPGAGPSNSKRKRG